MPLDVGGEGLAGATKAAAAAKAAGDGPPPSMATVTYWDDLYSDRVKPYDTLYGYEDIRHALSGLLQTHKAGDLRVLHVGCGTSNVTEGLWRDGFRHICNVDFSEVVVDLMAKRWSHFEAELAEKSTIETVAKKSVHWLHMDATDLASLKSCSFDLVLEKFTLDAILCEAKDDALDKKGCAAIREFHRVLVPHGTFISLAWGEKTRTPLLRGGGLFCVRQQRIPGNALQRPLIYFCNKQNPGVAPEAMDATAFSKGSVDGDHRVHLPGLAAKLKAGEALLAPSTSQEVAGNGCALVHEREGMIELCIDFGCELRSDDVEFDVDTQQVRWRLRPCTGTAAENATSGESLMVWRKVKLPKDIDKSAAIAHWAHVQPPVATTAPVTAPSTHVDGVSRKYGRTIRVTAPLLTKGVVSNHNSTIPFFLPLQRRY